MCAQPLKFWPLINCTRSGWSRISHAAISHGKLICYLSRSCLVCQNRAYLSHRFGTTTWLCMTTSHQDPYIARLAKGHTGGCPVNVDFYKVIFCFWIDGQRHTVMDLLCYHCQFDFVANIQPVALKFRAYGLGTFCWRSRTSAHKLCEHVVFRDIFVAWA